MEACLIANPLGTIFTCIVIIVSSANICWRVWRTIFALFFTTLFAVGKFSVFFGAQRKKFSNLPSCTAYLYCDFLFSKKRLYNYDKKKFSKHVCKYTVSKQIELEGPGWSGFEENCNSFLTDIYFWHSDAPVSRYKTLYMLILFFSTCQSWWKSPPPLFMGKSSFTKIFEGDFFPPI